jgi:hypothetical protein
VTLTLLFAGGGEAADAAGKILPGPPVRLKWTAFLALARISEDVIRREMCDVIHILYVYCSVRNNCGARYVVSLCSNFVVMVKKKSERDQSMHLHPLMIGSSRSVRRASRSRLAQQPTPTRRDNAACRLAFGSARSAAHFHSD